MRNLETEELKNSMREDWIKEGEINGSKVFVIGGGKMIVSEDAMDKMMDTFKQSAIEAFDELDLPSIETKPDTTAKWDIKPFKKRGSNYTKPKKRK
jgi:coproporphyrinogen III oxidase-like Fe-S oxidoreductase